MTYDVTFEVKRNAPSTLPRPPPGTFLVSARHSSTDW
jgi:hypothetical protein